MAARKQLDKEETAVSAEKHRQLESAPGRAVSLVAKLRPYLEVHPEGRRIYIAGITERLDTMQKVAGTPPEHYLSAFAEKVLKLPY